MQSNIRKCSNENCILKDKCSTYSDTSKPLADWLTCSNYSQFESNDIEMQKYKRNKLNNFLTTNNLQKENLTADETAKAIDFISKLNKEIIEKSLQK